MLIIVIVLKINADFVKIDQCNNNKTLTYRSRVCKFANGIPVNTNLKKSCFRGKLIND